MHYMCILGPAESVFSIKCKQSACHIEIKIKIMCHKGLLGQWIKMWLEARCGFLEFLLLILTRNSDISLVSIAFESSNFDNNVLDRHNLS